MSNSAAQDFATTRWSVVLAARDGGDARSALGELCARYWYPLYAFVRRQGHSPEDAQDLTQEFFARLIEREWLGDVARERGRFRSWLLASMRHFLANEWNRARAQKRGGGAALVSLDESDAEAATSTSLRRSWMPRSFSSAAGRSRCSTTCSRSSNAKCARRGSSRISPR